MIATSTWGPPMNKEEWKWLIIVAMLLLIAGAKVAKGEEWDQYYDGGPVHDMECSVSIDSYRVLYTYHHLQTPRLPVQGMTCKARDVEGEAKVFIDNSKLFDQFYEKQKPAAAKGDRK
jgi:hypothetical protein